MLRDLAFGLGAATFFLWLTFFATEGAVEVATVMASAAALIWFTTVDPRRLVDATGHPHFTLFALTLLGAAVVVSGAIIIGTVTLLLAGLITIAGVTTGVTRAVRFGYLKTDR